MSLKKTVAIAAAASALAAISVPAMAFENEVHGTYTFRYYLTNYEQAGPNNLTGAPPAGNATSNLKTNNYFEQRARVFYTAKASDDLKLVTAFEIDSDFGDKAQGSVGATGGNATTGVGTAFRNSGGALEADAVNLETKWVYLDFAIPSTPVRVKAGIQPFKDQIKGIFGDFDAAGVMTATKVGAATINAGYMRLYDQSFLQASTAPTRVKGIDNLDMGALEVQVALTKDTKIGFDYYLLNDGRSTQLRPDGIAPPANGGTFPQGTTPAADTNAARTGTGYINLFAINGETKVGPLTLSSFAAYEYGIFHNATRTNTNTTLNAFAFNAAAKAAVGPGTLRTAFLFTSGNDNDASNGNSSHATGWVGVTQSPNDINQPKLPVNSYNEGGMLLLNRNTADKITNTDVTMVSSTGNGNNGALSSQGLWLATVGFDATITPKAYLNTNLGLAWAAHTNNQKPVNQNIATLDQRNGTNFMGAEVNIEAGYKMYDNLTAKLQAGYVMLGGYYKDTLSKAQQGNGSVDTPENPYTARMMLSYAF
jgi:hypothetical protein